MEAARQPWPALGVLLVRDGLVSKEELETILAEQRDARNKRISGHQLGELLVASGSVTQTQVARLVAEQYELPFLELETTGIDLSAARALEEEIARRLSAIPISRRDDGSFVLAIADPATVLFSDEIRRALVSATHFVVVGPEAIEAALAFVHDRDYVPPVTTGDQDDEDWQGVVVELRSGDSTAATAIDADSIAEVPTATHQRPPLGALLLREGLVTDEELEEALTQQSLSTSWRLGEILVDRGTVTSAVIARLIAEQYELTYTELANHYIEPDVAALLRYEIAREFPAVPIAANPDGSLEVAIADPTNVYYSDELHSALGVPLTFVVASPDAIEALLETVHIPIAVVELDSEAQVDEIEPLVASDRAEAVTVEAEDVVRGSEDLPEFVIEHVAVEEPAAVEGRITVEEPTSAEEPTAEKEIGTGPPTWTTELALTEDVVETAEHEHGRVDEPEAVTTPADELDVVLLTEVTEIYDPAEPAADTSESTEFPVQFTDSAHEVSLALHEVESAAELTETEAVDEPAEDEAAIGLAEADAFADTSEFAELPVQFDDLDAEDPTAEHEHGRVDEPEAITTPADELDAVLLTEVTEIYDPAEPAADTSESTEFPVQFTDSAHEVSLALHEVESAAELTETEAVDEPAEDEAAIGLAEADAFADTSEFAELPVQFDDLDAEDPTAEHEHGRVDEPEAITTPADELDAVLLTEVTEIYDPAEPAADTSESTEFPVQFTDSAHEVSLALHEVESAAELTETEAVDEPAEDEAAIGLAEADAFADTSEFAELPVQFDDLDAEDPVAYADDLDAAIEEVLALGASAIHFSPQGEWHTVRARIDGLVRELGVVAKGDLVSLVDRVEASAAMRVDVVPTKQGDKVILFPREQAGSPRVLSELSLTSDATDAINSALLLPSGAIVVCGPVGSGTTTTLYAALGALNTSDRVVASIEDPVERVLEGVDQAEVSSASGVTFADGLRTLLSSDSDVVLVGEIRDQETADVALQAALDGRHILAGLRAPSAASAIRRLADMGLDANVLSAALTCVIAQRLVRRICADCRETYYASDAELAELGQPSEGGSPRLLARGKGCGACDGTGFRGRIGLFEILRVTEETRSLVCDGASVKKLQRAAVAGGMQTLRDDGVRLCLEGVTTAAEVRRVLGVER